MNSDFNPSEVSELITEALTDPTDVGEPIRSYGQIGFMETKLIENIYNSLEEKLSNSKFLEVVQDARVGSVANTNKLSITSLHTVTHNCRKCSFSEITPNLPKWNVNNPDVLFIVDSSAIDQQASALFVSALKSAGFSSDKVCLTYLLRCPTKSYEQQYIDNCLQYLHTEIQIMNPRLICPIGANVLSSLFGTELKIKDYKNKITWLGSWPILPLYSLHYVLKSGESAQSSFQSDMIQAYQFCYKKTSENGKV
jgi:uracil-DNA glycosylase family 4